MFSARWSFRDLKPDEPVPLEVAVRLGKHGGDRGLPRGEDGKFKKPAETPQADNCQVADDARNYGNSAAYLTARLRRDNPELAERVDAGELTPHAAAIEAGWRKPPPGLVELRGRRSHPCFQLETHCGHPKNPGFVPASEPSPEWSDSAGLARIDRGEVDCLLPLYNIA